MKKNLIIDGNYVLNKNVFTLIKNNCLYGDFYKALTMNVQKYSHMYDFDRVVFVSDSRRKSWRKRILDKYKAHRKTDQEIDWEWIYANYAEFKKSISEEMGVIVLEAEHVEGDDWVSAFVHSSWKEGDTNVVISSDKDLTQLLRWSDNQINLQIEDNHGRERIYVPEGYKIYVNGLDDIECSDPFDLNGSYEWKSVIERLLRDWTVEEINSKEVLLEKLVKGDKADNIDSVYQKVVKGGKIQNIGDGGAKKVWDYYVSLNDENYDIRSQKFLTELAKCVCVVNKLDENEMTKSIEKRLDQNRSLIELSHRHWPTDIKEKIIEELETIF